MLGSAAVAFDNDTECGVAVALDVQYLATAKVGETVEWEATVLKRGKRLVTAEVKASVVGRGPRDGRTRKRLIAVGTVTKSLRGAPDKLGKQ